MRHLESDIEAVGQCKSRKAGGADISFASMSQFIGAMNLAGVSTGFFVTNAAFTSEARRAAREWQVNMQQRQGGGDGSAKLHLYSHEELTMLLQRHYEVLSNDKYIASLLEDQARTNKTTTTTPRKKKTRSPEGSYQRHLRSSSKRRRQSFCSAPQDADQASAAVRRPFAIGLVPTPLVTFVCISRRPHRPRILQQLLWMGLAPLPWRRDDAADAANRITR